MKHPHLSLKNNKRVSDYLKVENVLLKCLRQANTAQIEPILDSVEFIRQEKDKIIQRGYR